MTRGGAEAMSSTFAVLGAGLIGRLMALALARNGRPVVLYDKSGPDAADSAAYAAAAMLAPLAESVIAEPLVAELGHASLGLWPKILAELPEPVFFQQNGSLVVWHTQDRDQAALFGVRAGFNAHVADGVPQPREVRGAEIQELEPALGGRFSRGLLLPGEGQLDNRGALTALLHALEAAGVECRWHTPMEAAAVPDGVFVIDCRGVGAKPDWAKVRGVRGEVLRVQTQEVHLNRPVRLLHPRYPLYIVPKPDGVYVIGATEIETEDFSPASVRSALELLSALYSVHPAFGEARILELAAQCRPALPDHLPAIRWDGERLFQINGLYRHGWLIAPAVRNAALELIRHVEAGGSSDWEAWCAGQDFPALYNLFETS